MMLAARTHAEKRREEARATDTENQNHRFYVMNMGEEEEEKIEWYESCVHK